MTFKKLIERPVWQVCRTGYADADNHVTPELEKEFMKIVKQLGGKTVARLLLSKMNSQSNKISDTGDKTLPKDLGDAAIHESEEEDLLIKKGIKIKTKHSTKFGVEYVLFKKYTKEELQKILKDKKITVDGDSVFVFSDKYK